MRHVGHTAGTRVAGHSGTRVLGRWVKIDRRPEPSDLARRGCDGGWHGPARRVSIPGGVTSVGLAWPTGENVAEVERRARARARPRRTAERVATVGGGFGPRRRPRCFVAGAIRSRLHRCVGATEGGGVAVRRFASAARRGRGPGGAARVRRAERRHAPVPVPPWWVQRGACRSGGAAAVLEDRVVRKAEVLEQRRVDERVDGADAPGDDVEHLDGERRRLATRLLRPVDRNG